MHGLCPPVTNLLAEVICHKNGEYLPASALVCIACYLTSGMAPYSDPLPQNPRLSTRYHSPRVKTACNSMHIIHSCMFRSHVRSHEEKSVISTVGPHGQLRSLGPILMHCEEKGVIESVIICRIEVRRGPLAVTSLRAMIISRLFLSTSPSCVESSQATVIRSHQRCLEPPP